jgi:ketosteroid isomerase-like protein
MKSPLRPIILAASLLASLATPSVTSAAGPPAVSPEHRATLDAYRTAITGAYLRGRPEDAVRPLAESVRLLPAYQKSIFGKADAATYYRAFLKRFAVRAYERSPIEVADLGQRVMEIGRFTMTVQAGQTEPQTFTGKYMDLWEKSSGAGPTSGGLMLHTAAWNHDQPPKSAEQLRFAEVPSVHQALQARAPVTPGLRLELAALQKLEESAIAQHDGKTWALFYADDGIVLSNQGTVVSGRKALDEYFERHAKALPVFEKLDMRTHQIDDLGDYAVEYSSAVVNWKMNEWSGVSLGKGILIWRRAVGGPPQIWRAISMYD